MDNLYGNYDSNGNLVGVFRNSGDVAPFTATDAELEDCCCGCGQDVKEAVAERQKAAGVTPIDTSKTWKLSELKIKVNDIAPNYIADNSYITTTGHSTKPSMLSSSYADSASTCDELLTLVKDMQITKIADGDNTSDGVGFGDGGYAPGSYDFVSGTNSTLDKELPEPESWSSMISGAESDFTFDSTGSPSSDDYYWEHYTYLYDYWREYEPDSDDYGWKQSAYTTVQRLDYNATAPSADSMSRRGYLYVKAETPEGVNPYDPNEEDRQFDAQGLSVSENAYTTPKNTGWTTDTDLSLQFGRSTKNPNWPSTYPDAVDHDTDHYTEHYVAGFRVYKTNMFELAEWDFTYV